MVKNRTSSIEKGFIIGIQCGCPDDRLFSTSVIFNNLTTALYQSLSRNIPVAFEIQVFSVRHIRFMARRNDE